MIGMCERETCRECVVLYCIVLCCYSLIGLCGL
jgi:hypothetical protein